MAGSQVAANATELAMHAAVAAGGLMGEDGTRASVGELHVALLVIGTCVIALTLIFELLKEGLMEMASGELRPILEHLFGELTVLGFIGLMTFVVVKFKLMADIAKRVFGDDDSEVLAELTENVHMAVFLVALLYLFQALLLVRACSFIKRQWKHFEKEAMVTGFDAAQSCAEQRVAAKRAGVSGWWQSYVAYERLQYYALREAFVTVMPHHMKAHTELELEQLRRHMHEKFDFSEYLSILLGETLGELVEIPLMTWIYLWGFFVAFWAVLYWAPHSILQYALIVFAYLLVAGLVAIARKLLWIRWMVTVPRLFQRVNTIMAKLTSRTETTPLLDDSINAHTVDISGGRKRLDSSTTSKARYMPPFLKMPGHEPAKHRQLELFWFGHHGRHVLLGLVRLAMMLLSMYIAVFFVAIVPTYVEALSTTGLVLTLVFAILPVLCMPPIFRVIMVAYTQSSFVELLRVPSVIMKVIRTQKTRRAIQVLKLITSLRGHETQVSAQVGGGRGKKKPTKKKSDADLHGALEKAFTLIDEDGSGFLEASEITAMLERFGMADQVSVGKILEDLDSDGSGEVGREEFIAWMEDKHLGAQAVQQTPEELVNSIFSVLDRDNSGTVSTEELFTTLNSLGEDLSYEDVREIINDIDTDGNGQIDREEFLEMIKVHAEHIL